MSIKAIGNYFRNIFSKSQTKTFLMENSDGLPFIQYSRVKEGKNFKNTIDEVSIGNKTHVLITHYDYSQSPVTTTILSKEKGYENGKLVYSSPINVKYEHESFMGDIFNK